MPELKTHKVSIGDETFEVQRFRGLKALLAVAAMTRIGREVPDVLADAVKDYRHRNTVTVTEAMRRLPQFSGFTKEDFDEAEKRTGKREIELPAPMDQNEQILRALPELLEKARKEVIRLFAILITPNQELAEADRNDDVEAVLDKHKDLLLYEAELDQLADLALAAQDIVTNQLSERKDRLGKMLRGLWGILRGRSTPQIPDSTTETPTTSTAELETGRASRTSETPRSEPENSSTSSPPRTDGAESTPSMVSPGAS